MKNWSPDGSSPLAPRRFPLRFPLVTAAGLFVLAAGVVVTRLFFPTPTPPRSTPPSPSVKATAAKATNAKATNASKTETATDVTGFAAALPGYRFQFPRDDASHPSYMTEWWYYTGHLRNDAGERFGYQLTFFRNALTPHLQRRSQWAVRDVMLAHLALTDEKGQRFYFTDRIARGSAGIAGATPIAAAKRDVPFEPKIWLYDWSLQFTQQGRVTQQGRGRQYFSAFGESEEGDKQPFGLTLTNEPLKPPAIHGTDGVSQKSAGRGHASHYYSYTRLASQGEVRIGAQRFQVTGQSWFDHEFGSNQLEANQAGWDWFSLQLDDGRELMLYQLRLKDGRIEPYSSGTLVEKDGRTRHLRLRDFKIEVLDTWHSRRSGANYPALWRLTLPDKNIVLTVKPTVSDQELETRRSTNITYWEGSVSITGTQNNQPLHGAGYIELTGYAEQFNNTF